MRDLSDAPAAAITLLRRISRFAILRGTQIGRYDERENKNSEVQAIVENLASDFKGNASFEHNLRCEYFSGKQHPRYELFFTEGPMMEIVIDAATGVDWRTYDEELWKKHPSLMYELGRERDSIQASTQEIHLGMDVLGEVTHPQIVDVDKLAGDFSLFLRKFAEYGPECGTYYFSGGPMYDKYGERYLSNISFQVRGKMTVSLDFYFGLRLGARPVEVQAWGEPRQEDQEFFTLAQRVGAGIDAFQKHGFNELGF